MNCEIILYAYDTNSNIFVACDSLKSGQKFANKFLTKTPSPAWFANSQSDAISSRMRGRKSRHVYINGNNYNNY